MDENQGLLGQMEDNGDEEEEEREYRQMDLSIFSAGGLTQPHTMKLQGTIKNSQTMVLIDSGASHNFISTELVKQLGLRAVKLRYGKNHVVTASDTGARWVRA